MTDDPFSPDGEHDPLDRRLFLPRLHRGAYQGQVVVHWTLTMHDRMTGWLSETLHLRFREILLHTQTRGSVLCPVYVLMPDHMHLLWMGCSKKSDQCTSMAFLRRYLEPWLAPAKFQHQPHDHVLRADERTGQAFVNAVNYILENPVRAGIVKSPSEWPHLGCLIPGYPNLHPFQADFWEKFWRIREKVMKAN